MVRFLSTYLDAFALLLKRVCIVICEKICYTIINQDSLSRYCVQFRAEEPHHLSSRGVGEYVKDVVCW